MRQRDRYLLLLLSALSATIHSLAGCSVEAVTDFVAGRVGDCLDEDGCIPEDPGTPLDRWRPPGLSVNALFGEGEGRPVLSVLLVAREWTPFCPEIPSSIAANIDGIDLERSDWDLGFVCPEVLWELGPDEWPDQHEEASNVEVRDDETILVLSVPFSLTRPPTVVLGSAALQPGDSIDVRADPPVPGLQLEAVELRAADADPVVLSPRYEGDGVHFDMPGKATPGPATLDVTVAIYSDAECNGTEFCEATVYSEHRFDVLVTE